MRICLISREYPPDTGWGGVGAYTYQMAQALAKRGHDVEVIALAAAKSGNTKAKTNAKAISTRPDNGAPASSPDPPRASSVKVHRVEWENLLEELNLFLICAPSTHFVLKSGVALWKKFLDLHSKQPFDVVEVPEHLAAGILNGVTRLAPLVVKLHTPHSKFVTERFHHVLPSLDHQLICLLERVTMLSADVLCSPSANLAEFVATDMNIPLPAIELTRNPVDTTWFNPDGARAEIGTAQPTIVFVGRLEERKGIRYLIEALPRIVAVVPNAQLIVVGADTNTGANGGSVLSELHQQLAASSIADHVTFVPHVALAEVASYYRCADVCVVPSLYENAPYTCIEAMSCGKALVVTDAGGTAEYVKHGESGFVVPARNADALAESIIKLLNDSELRERFGKAARHYIETECSREVIAESMERMYSQAITRHNKKKLELALYNKPAQQVLADTLELLCAIDQAIFDVLYAQSCEFRLRYWWRFLRNRPGLCAATLTAKVARKVGAVKQAEKLEQRIAGKQSARYGVTAALGFTTN